MNKQALLNDDKLSNGVSSITNQLADAFDALEDKSSVDVSAFASAIFDDNLTSTLNTLIRLNAHYTKEEITFLLHHYSEFLAAMSLMLMKASELDY